MQDAPASSRVPSLDPDAVTSYDVSEFEKTDPKLLLYRPGDSIATGFERVKRFAVAAGNRVWVAGDKSVKRFGPGGSLEGEIALSRPPHCLRVTGPDELFIGLGNFFEAYDFSGKRKLESPRLGENAFITALAVHDRTVYVADAGSREMLVCDRGTGAVTARFGHKDQPPGAPGFVVPSPYFDLAVGREGRLHIANPGRLRVETYTLDGRFESSWGGPGMAIDRFCGCCNPVYLTLTPEGDIITSEKGLARINLYAASGAFKGAVAGPETLVDDKELAKRACNDCRVGAGFDVALDSEGRVLALDPYRKTVRTFIPLSAAGGRTA
jgi:hypothetical protein